MRRDTHSFFYIIREITHLAQGPLCSCLFILFIWKALGYLEIKDQRRYRREVWGTGGSGGGASRPLQSTNMLVNYWQWLRMKFSYLSLNILKTVTRTKKIDYIIFVISASKYVNIQSFKEIRGFSFSELYPVKVTITKMKNWNFKWVFNFAKDSDSG